jgi:hypothetical protein
MRLFCRKEHDDNRCPSGPVHDFQDGAYTTDEGGVACFWCVRCGDVRQLMPASVTAPALETIKVD